MNSYTVRFVRATPVYGWRSRDIVSWNNRRSTRKVEAGSPTEAIDKVTAAVTKNAPAGTVVIPERVWEMRTGLWREINLEGGISAKEVKS